VARFPFGRGALARLPLPIGEKPAEDYQAGRRTALEGAAYLGIIK